jgi:proteasome alpha subunit
MLTPYDWQEGIAHRAQYIESRIVGGSPVLAVSLEEGILAGSFRRHARKLFEIYDRLIYSGIGLQSDVESLRVASIEFAHREGFQRSEQDVTIQRVVTAMSQPIKNAFANFNSPPFVAKALFMEVCDSIDEDRYYCLDYDGDYVNDRRWSWLGGTGDIGEKLAAAVHDGFRPDLGVEASLAFVESALKQVQPQSKRHEPEPLVFEAALLERNKKGDRRFKPLAGFTD